MIQAYIKMWKNAFNFSGRTSREDYWWAVLANVIVVFAIGMVSGIIGVVPALISDELATIGAMLSYLISGVYSLALLIPGISICIRRLHDIGKSGWMYLICSLGSFCCGIGSIIFIVFMCMDSQPGPNQWGPNPKEMNMNSYGMSGYGTNGYNQNNGFNQNNPNQF